MGNENFKLLAALAFGAMGGLLLGNYICGSGQGGSKSLSNHLATLQLILVGFSSFALAAYLNRVIPGDFYDFRIVGGAYILMIILLIIKIFKTKTPLFGNFFARMISTVLDLETEDASNLKGLKHAVELSNQKIDASKIKIKGDLQLLRFTIFEALFKEFIALFKSGKKEKGRTRKAEKEEMTVKTDKTDKTGKTNKTDNTQ